jgi:hypothetical protein
VKYILVGISVLLAVVGTLVSRFYFSKNSQQSLSSTATWGATHPHCVKQPDGMTVKTKTLVTMPNGDQGEIDFESVIFNKGKLRSISGLFEFRPKTDGASGNPSGHGGTSGGGGYSSGNTTGPGAGGSPRAGSDGPPGAMTYRQTAPSPTPNAYGFHPVDVAYNPAPIVEFGKELIMSNRILVPTLPTEAIQPENYRKGLRFEVQISNTGQRRYRMVPLTVRPEFFRGIWTEESDDDLSAWVDQILHLTEYYQSQCQVQFNNRVR